MPSQSCTYRVVHRKKNFFTASNEPFNDPELSWGARGIMGYLLSQADNWEARNYDLYAQTKAGKTAVDRMIRELKAAGYMRRYKTNDEKGQLVWVTEVYEEKSLNPNYQPTVQNQTIGSPTVQKPTVGKTDVGKPDYITNTNTTNTNITKRLDIRNGKAPDDFLAHCVGTDIEDRKRFEPVLFLAERIAQILGTSLPSTNGRAWEWKWESPISEWLDKAGGDVNVVDGDLQIIQEQYGDEDWFKRCTTASSLDGMMMKQLTQQVTQGGAINVY